MKIKEFKGMEEFFKTIAKMDLKSSEFRVLLAWVCDADTFNPAHSLLAERTGIARPNITRALKGLVDAGVLIKVGITHAINPALPAIKVAAINPATAIPVDTIPAIPVDTEVLSPLIAIPIKISKEPSRTKPKLSLKEMEQKWNNGDISSDPEKVDSMTVDQIFDSWKSGLNSTSWNYKNREKSFKDLLYSCKYDGYSKDDVKSLKVKVFRLFPTKVKNSKTDLKQWKIDAENHYDKLFASYFLPKLHQAPGEIVKDVDAINREDFWTHTKYEGMNEADPWLFNEDGSMKKRIKPNENV